MVSIEITLELGQPWKYFAKLLSESREIRFVFSSESE